VAVSAVTFHPGGRLVAAGGRDGDVRLWDVANGRPVGPPLYNAGPTRAVAFDAAGRRLAAAGDDGTIRVWPVPAPVTGTAADVQRWVTKLTGRRLDAGGAVESAEDADRRTTAPPNSDH
jgi:WD40 repeat protein